MHLVILHYHLNRGGVTSVIENHLRSLASLAADEFPQRVTVVYGGRWAAWKAELAAELPFDCELVEIPALEYDNFQTRSESLVDALNVLLRPMDRAETVLHFHNHSLGKNGDITHAVGRLADDGWRLLLQIHDFAEDLRPANYQHLMQRAGSMAALQARLYPQAEQIHYAVLNDRDRQILDAAGVVGDRLHLLPNPVQSQTHDATEIAGRKSELSEALAIPDGHHFVLYPVRPIRRKNIGELLLWSVLVEDATFALTLAPLNPHEQASYQRWVDFAVAKDLHVEFEIASRVELPFEAAYASADAIITTSVAEGFGMVYLEASLAGRRLLGRKLTEVCRDFEAAGMEFPELSQTFRIPAHAVDIAAARRSHQRWLAQLRTDYGLSSAVNTCSSSDEDVFLGDTADFARLESDQQRDFLQRAIADPSLRETLRQLNPNLQAFTPEGKPSQQTLQHNCRVIADHYAPSVIGRRLRSVYENLLSSHPSNVTGDPSIAQSILNRFVHPALLFPIRLES